MRKKVILVALLLCGAVTVRAQSDRVDFRIGESIQTLVNIFKEANLFYVDSVDSDKMLRDAAKGMLEKLDPYTVYIPSDEMEDFETMTTGKYAGVGAAIRQKGEWVEFIEPYYYSPSDKAGIKAGDRIISINGVNLKNATSQKVSSMLRGEAETTLEIEIQPIKDTLTIRKIVLKREQITQPSVPYYGMVADSIGYIRLESFTEACSSEVAAALKEMERKTKLKGVIIDLRMNGGGIVGQAVDIASMFVPKGTKIVDLKGKIKEFNTTYSTKKSPIDTQLPLVVLMSNVSASASEILAGSLQDLDRAVIVGQRSYGKGLVQTTKPVSSDSYLKVTTAQYYTPSGRCIQALDYTHRKDDGSVGHIPESLIVEYKTKAGRKVYNGGGIQPDVILEDEYLGKFTAILLGYGFIDDFANQYAAKNESASISDFVMTDEIYNSFVDFMRDKTIQYESATALKLKELRQWAEREKYSDRLNDEFTAIEHKIAEDKMVELHTFETEIRDVLADEIIKRWHYAQGAIEYTLRRDKEVKEAVKILENNTEYNRILSEQNTEKN